MRVLTRAIDGLRSLKHPLTGRLGILLSLFILLMIGAYAVSAWSVEQKAYDASVLNVAGRQRALIQKYTRHINRALVALAVSDWETLLEERTAGANTASLFEKTHQGFLDGGATIFGARSAQELWLPRTDNELAREHLLELSDEWAELKRVAALSLRSDSRGLRDNENVAAIQAQCALAATAMDSVVSQMQFDSENKLRRIKTFQAASTAAGCLLFVGIMLFAHIGIILPLDRARTDLVAKNRELTHITARTRAIVDNAADGIITIDEQGIIELFNAAAEQIFGYRADEAIGNNVTMLMPIPYRKEHDAYLQKYLETGVKKVVGIRREVVGLRKDGSTFPMDLGVSEVVLGDRRMFTGIARDITERRQAEQALRESEARLSASFENAPAMMVLLDEDRRVRKANRAAMEFSGRRADEIVGLRGGEAFSCFHALDDPKGCGFGPFCETCPVRWTVLDTLRTGKRHYQVEGKLPLGDRGRQEQMDLLISTVALSVSVGRMVLVCIEDITARKQAKEEIERQNRFLNTVLESLDHPFLVIDAEDHSVLMANKAAWRHTPKESGASPDASSSSPRANAPMTCYALTHHRDTPCDGTDDQCPLAEVKRTGRPAKVEHVHYQADGSPRNVEVHAYPVFDENRRVVQVIEYSLDITERKRVEEALRRFRAALDTSADVVFLIDRAAMRFVDVNETACASLGYSREELLAMGPQDIKPHYTKDQLSARFDELIESKVDVGAIETVHRRKDGSDMSVEVMVRCLEKDGKYVLVAVARDITERKRAEAQLEDVNRQLVGISRQAGMAEVATGVLHNVGNVLNSVNVSASVVADKLRKSRVSGLAKAADLMREHADDLGTFVSEDEKGKQLPGYLTRLAEHLSEEQGGALEELKSLTANIEHIKKIIRMQQSYTGVHGIIEPVSIGEVLDDALKIDAASLQRHGVEVVREYNETPAILVDKHKLLQILVNLMRNAKHALLDGGRQDKRLTLRIGARKDSRTSDRAATVRERAQAGNDSRTSEYIGARKDSRTSDPRSSDDRLKTGPTPGERSTPGEHGQVRIEVIDSGVGISKENLTRIFSYGFTTKKDGHGFGLHSSALAAKEMGGSLTAHSEGPGKGASFTLELPLKEVEVRR